MDKRKIGKSKLFVNPVGLGCMGFSHAYGKPTEKSEAVKIIREAFEIGYNFFDTAECYTGFNPDGTVWSWVKRVVFMLIIDTSKQSEINISLK